MSSSSPSSSTSTISSSTKLIGAHNNNQQQLNKLPKLIVSLIEFISCQLSLFCRRMSKIILRLLTGKCQLARICANEKIESCRIRKLEACLLASKNAYLKNTIRYSFTDATHENEEQAVLNIMQLKKIARETNIK